MRNILIPTVFLCCAWAGMRSGNELFCTHRELTRLCAGFRRLTQRIRFGEMRLADALNTDEEPLFGQISVLMEQGKSPGESWRECAAGARLSTGIRRELDAFFDSLGRMDKAGQLEELLRMTELMEEEREQAGQKAKQQARLRATLGVLVGAVSVVAML